jgi:hypothetical protein
MVDACTGKASNVGVLESKRRDALLGQFIHAYLAAQ